MSAVDAEPSIYYLCASAATNRRLDDSHPDDDGDYDTMRDAMSRASRIFAAAFERVIEPGRGWTSYMFRLTTGADDDHCQIEMPEGAPMARFRTEVLFDPNSALDEYDLMRPEWMPEG